MDAKLYNQNGETIGTMDLPASVFGLKWNADLVHQVVMGQRANRRQKVAHTKTRGEVRGGGKKPWRQKGTGRARHGSIRSPIWRGGGVTHGPRTEKNFTKKVNKKMARKALSIILSAKLRDNELRIVDRVDLGEAKTKKAAALLRVFIKGSGMEAGKSILFVLSDREPAFMRAFRNLYRVHIAEARNLNAHDILQYRYLIFLKKAVEALRA